MVVEYGCVLAINQLDVDLRCKMSKRRGPHANYKQVETTNI